MAVLLSFESSASLILPALEREAFCRGSRELLLDVAQIASHGLLILEG
jgi:hypothetical protein